MIDLGKNIGHIYSDLMSVMLNAREQITEVFKIIAACCASYLTYVNDCEQIRMIGINRLVGY